MSDLTRRLCAELIGTFWLVLGGCGAAVFAGDVIGAHGVALAFGLTVVTGAYALGHISGGHFNPAVTLGQVVAKRFDAKHALPYMAAQVVGAVIAAAVIYLVANDRTGFSSDGNFLAANGYGVAENTAGAPIGSPGGFGLLAGIVTELVMTFMFLMVILGATAKKAHPALAGLAIGLCLTLIHLISIPVTNTSVNPARSIGPALFVGGDALVQLWLFIVVPMVGAALAGLAHNALFGDSESELTA